MYSLLYVNYTSIKLFKKLFEETEEFRKVVAWDTATKITAFLSIYLNILFLLYSFIIQKVISQALLCLNFDTDLKNVRYYYYPLIDQKTDLSKALLRIYPMESLYLNQIFWLPVNNYSVPTIQRKNIPFIIVIKI